MLNPVITSMRSLCHVSHCRKIRQVSAAPFSPAAFSEGQHVFDPGILEKVVRQLAQENQGRGQAGHARVRQALAALTAVDGTVLRAERDGSFRHVGFWVSRLEQAGLGITTDANFRREAFEAILMQLFAGRTACRNSQTHEANNANLMQNDPGCCRENLPKFWPSAC
jgi:hypothetical protein